MDRQKNKWHENCNTSCVQISDSSDDDDDCQILMMTVMMMMTMNTMNVLMVTFIIGNTSHNQVTFLVGHKWFKNKSTNLNKYLKNAFDKFV